MKDITFDTAIKRMEEIVDLLESGGQTLEDSIKLFEEGAKLSKLCAEKLKKAEQKIVELSAIESDEN